MTSELFTDAFEIIENENEVTKHASCYGNEFYTITKEDIDALLNGKILFGFATGEYGTFICMENDD